MRKDTAGVISGEDAASWAYGRRTRSSVIEDLLMKHAIIAIMLGLAAASVEAQQVKTFAGGFTNGHYRFNRPQDFTTTYSGQFAVFHVYQFTNTIAQTVTISATGTGFTPWLFIYDFSFNPQSQNGGLYALGQGSVSVSLPASAFVPYYLVVAGNTASDLGNYSGSFTAGNVGIVTNFHDGLSIYSHPIGNTVQSGSPYTMYAYSHGRLPHRFQWYYGPRPASTSAPNAALAIPNATNFSYTIPSVTVQTSYWCNIAANGLTTTNRRSSEVTVTPVVGPATFNGSLSGDNDTWDRMTLLNVSSGKTCYYETVTFQIITPGTYTVQVNSVGFPASLNSYINPFDPIRPGFNFYADGVVASAAGQLLYETYFSAGTYDLVISSSNSLQTGSFTGLIAGAATPLIIPGPTNPSIWSQSSGATILTGKTATLQFSSLGAKPRRYQWLSGHEGYITGATNKSYTTPVFLTPGDRWYWATVSNSYGVATTAQMRVRVVTNAPVYASNLRPGNKQWHRSNGAGGLVTEWSYYKVYAFEVQQAGTYTSRFTVTGGIDAMDLYSAVFDPNNANLSRYKFTTGGSPLTFVTTNLPAGNYNLVLSTTASLATGTFSGSVSGPALIRELGTPVFATNPSPLTQTNWPLETLLPITHSVSEPIVSYEWYPALAPGVPVDGQTAIAGATNTIYQPSPTATSRWYYLRAYNSYGYDDGPLAATLVRPKPAFAPNPVSTNFNYAMPGTNSAIITNVPFTIYWQTLTGSTVVATLTNFLQGVSTNYTNAIASTVLLSNYNAGVYGLRIVATNPSGVATSSLATITVNRRPLNVSLPGATNTFNGTTQSLVAAATDPIPGPLLPSPLPYTNQYSNGVVVLTNGAYDAGIWTTKVSITHSNFAGSATSVLQILRRPLTVTVVPTSNEYDGFPKTNHVTFMDPSPGPTLPVPMPQTRQYADGLHALTNPPYNSGIWTVSVTVAHSNFQGTGLGLLTITRSNLHRLASTRTDSNIVLQFTSRWGQSLDLQTSTNIFGPWTNHTTGLSAGTNETITLQLPLDTNALQLFYRAYTP